MSVLKEIHKRRLVPWAGAYLAAGFIALEGVDQLVGHGILSELAYRIVLVFYVFGIPGSLILAWFHGEKGTQKPRPIEFWLHGSLLVLALALSAVITRNFLAGRRLSDLAAASTMDPRHVAVLYFEDLSSDSELSYLADGLTEGLIDHLSEVRELDVVSRNGAAAFRDSEASRDSIARALDVGSLIEGSVDPVGDRVRVTVRLVEGTSGVDLQRQSFELPAGDLLALRDSLAGSVAQFLRERLGEEIRVRERRAGTSNVDAWALVQRGERIRKQAEELALHDTDAALASYQQADSVFALAGIADSQWPEPAVMRARIAYERARLYDTDPHSAGEWIEVGLEHAERATTLAPNLPRALEARGTLRYLKWLQDLVNSAEEAEALFAAAREDLERAVQIDPGLASAHAVLSHLYSQTHDLMSVAISAQRALHEDAYLSNADVILYRLFTVSYDLEQQSQAKRWCDEGARRFSENWRFTECQLVLLTMAPSEPDVDRAWELADRWVNLSSELERSITRKKAQMYVGGTIARAGFADSAVSVLELARADRDLDPRRDLARLEAYMRVLLGDYDEAIELLKVWVTANPRGIHGSEEEGETYWWWRNIENDPRFRRVMGEE